MIRLKKFLLWLHPPKGKSLLKFLGGDDIREAKMINAVGYLKFNSRRCFGVEMEFNRAIDQPTLRNAIRKADTDHEIIQSGNYARDYSNNYWHVKFDRSCGDRTTEGGWEVASYKARGFKDLALIGKVIIELKTAGAQCNKNCAVHVHTEISDYTQERAAALMANWMRIEDVILEMLPKHRRDNIYCVPLGRRFSRLDRNKSYTPADFWALVRPRSMGDPDRRVTLNMTNFAFNAPGRTTAEIRMPEGSCEADDIKNWARWFIHFVDTSMAKPFPESVATVKTVDEALSVCGLHSEDPFLILSGALRSTKIWFLRRLSVYCGNKEWLAQARRRLDLMTSPVKTLAPPAASAVTKDSRDELFWKDDRKYYEEYYQMKKSQRTWRQPT